ncbi:MAG: diguanylate cyclase [Spirochaetaceae bacterium]|jgi:diguanylate cyclase (GGDEF)-like protein|nr:diguanylate cyclase [Spirochaetaceae bacterium]
MQTNNRDFLSYPKVIENYALLEEIGVFDLISEMDQRVREYQSLLFGAAEIFNRMSIEEIMEATVSQISNQYLPSFIAFLWRPLQNREDVTLKGYQNYKLINLPYKIDTITPFVPFFQVNREPILYATLREELKDDDETRDIFASLEKLTPELVVPIIGPSGLYGLILVGHKVTADVYTDGELLFISQLMSFVSQAIQNHIHYEHSVRDVKTGLFNHGFLVPRLTEEISRVKRTGQVSSLMVIDVDKFKVFNDNYGHLAGDRVLEFIARAINKSVRTDDVPSRFGGEEFTILLPNTTAESAFLVAERLRDNIATMSVPWEAALPQVTISLGIASFTRDTNAGTDEIIHRADEALYRSKETGRNRTTIWHGDLAPGPDKKGQA